MNKMNEFKRILPDRLWREIVGVLSSRVGGEELFSELRLSAEGRCSMLHGGDSLTLMCRLSRAEIEEILGKATHGSVYAHRDTVKEGYAVMEGGIRLGISGRAVYDGGELIGITDVRSLVFRIPLSACDFEERLLSLAMKNLKKGILIYSPPGLGKTTALRALSGHIAKKHRLCIIDERGELDTGDATDAVILSGYKKAVGIEIATRTHSPELLMLDELGPSDTEPLLMALKCGVPIIATAHAGSFSELLEKRSIAPLIEANVFGAFIEISKKNKKYKLKKYTLADIKRENEKRKEKDGSNKIENSPEKSEEAILV
ncbi:MAG: Flp pilus assembly complex ATPase component TadA [Clostridia bacterium]|nr:Flp pilus assembly complex ATPase component TadA [Clostridia bacterium]